MKVLIPIVIGLLVVGCGNKQTANTDDGKGAPEKSAEKKEVIETPTLTSWASDPSDPNNVKIEAAVPSLSKMVTPMPRVIRKPKKK
jgi:hypothetical protein